MKFKLTTFALLVFASSIACEQKSAGNSVTATSKSAVNSATPEAMPTDPIKDGDYDGTGVVTKIDTQLGSVEVNHDEIKDLMPAMQMEFFVADKKLLEGLKVGDKVDFVIRYKARNETIVKISKSK